MFKNISWSPNQIFFQYIISKNSNNFQLWKTTLKIRILGSLTKFFIILVWISKNMIFSTVVWRQTLTKVLERYLNCCSIFFFWVNLHLLAGDAKTRRRFIIAISLSLYRCCSYYKVSTIYLGWSLI